MAKSRIALPKNDAWETGDLGRSLEHAVAVDDDLEQVMIDTALNLQPISIRLEKGLIEAFKFIAAHNKSIGYQTLMRQALHRFATGEVKNILRIMESQDNKNRAIQDEAPQKQEAVFSKAA